MAAGIVGLMYQDTSHARGFASDNWAGAHPEIIAAIERANTGHSHAYGDDPWTRSAAEKFRAHFGEESSVFFVFNGTAANVLSLQAGVSAFQAVVCAATSHINVDECGAPEKHIGCKLLPLASPDGKITPDMVAPLLAAVGNEHHSQPRAISIAQATEYGTVYSPDEIRALTDFAHANHMIVHMDGARIANAAAGLGASLREITADVGVDVLSFGGTKNGIVFGEAVVFLDRALADHFLFRRKQGMQLASKMRFIAAQFEALLTDDLWLRSASHSNAMARLLASELHSIDGVTVTQKVEANGVFAIFPREHVNELQKHSFFHVWDERTSECRLMCSFDTTEDDIRGFADVVRRTLA